MGDRFDWRWLFRTRCMAIAETVIDHEHTCIEITLCKRRRFHRGECRG